MNVTVRKRKSKNGVCKLYLDVYDPNATKVRTSKALDLIVYENPSSSQKKMNKQAYEAANHVLNQNRYL
jgi:hypothetical protein